MDMEQEPSVFISEVCAGWINGLLNSEFVRIADYGMEVAREPVQHEYVVAK
jgi:hypothetical protein